MNRKKGLDRICSSQAALWLCFNLVSCQAVSLHIYLKRFWVSSHFQLARLETDASEIFLLQLLFFVLYSTILFF